MLPLSILTRWTVQSTLRSTWSSGCVWCQVCRSVSVKTGGWKKKGIPARYLGQPSPYTHPHLVKHDSTR